MSNPSKFLETLAMAVAAGKSIRSACEVAGCSTQTGYNLSATAEFKNRVSAIRSEIVSQAVGIITAGATQAAVTLQELLGPENEPSVRMNAAKAILLQLGPLSELGELRERIDRLEGSKLKVAS
jgi:hypothetical protein